MIWFMAGADWEGRHDFGVARWPGITSGLCLTAALGAYLSNGRRGVALWLVLWALPGLVQLVRYRIASVGLDAIAYTRQMVADLPTTSFPPPIPTR